MAEDALRKYANFIMLRETPLADWAKMESEGIFKCIQRNALHGAAR